MVKKSVLINKKNKFKKASLAQEVFFCNLKLISDDGDDAIKIDEDATERLGEATQEVAKQSSKKKKIY